MNLVIDHFFFSVRGNFLLFTLSGWSKRALIARGNQVGFLEGYCCVLSLAIVAVDTAENGPSKVRQVTNKVCRNLGASPLLGKIAPWQHPAAAMKVSGPELSSEPMSLAAGRR